MQTPGFALPMQIRQKPAGTVHPSRFTALAVFLLLALSAPLARAQFRASIQGVVTDQSGAVVPGATLTLLDTGTNQKKVTTSDPAGVYNFVALPPDIFTLTVEKSGFETKVLDHLRLIPEQANAINVALQVGAATTSVTVNAETSPAIDRETANTQMTIDSNTIQHFAAFQRDATQLVQLAPGAISDGSRAGGNGGGFALPGTQSGASHGGGGNLGSSSSIFATENGPSANANGQQFENNGYSVDGISTVSAVWGGATIITPSEDSIDSVKVSTNAYDAENGRFNGAMTDITTKSGTNQLHGSLFVLVERPGLNAYQRWNGPASARPCTSAQTCTPAARGLLRNTDRFNQPGGSLGGPIWKNKIFAFFSYERQAQSVPATSTGWFATSQLASLAPSGSIASKYLTFKGSNVLGTLIPSATCADAGLTPANCTTVSGGLNVGTPLTTGLGKQDLSWVSTSQPGVGSGLGTTPDIAKYTLSIPTTTDFQQFYGRLDADATSKDHLSYMMYWVPSTKTNYNGQYGYNLFHHSQVNNAFTVVWNHVFSPTFLNEARANAAGWRYNEISSNSQAPFGLPQDHIMQLGSITLGSFGVPIGAVLDQWTYGYKDVATKVFHTQTLKFGFDLTQLHYLNDPIGAPNYTFYNLWDFMNDAPEAEGGPFQAKTGIPGGYRNDNRENIVGVFVQDNWKVFPTLTVSAGLRWSYFGPLTDKNHNMGAVQFGSGSALLTGISLSTSGGAWTAQKANFGPELGFNWAPDAFQNKLVVRGGFGLNYNGMEIANANNPDGNPPGTTSVPGSSTSPSNINPNILYATSTNPTSLFGYPANPHAVTSFNSAGLPTKGGANLGGLSNHMPTQYAYHYSLETDYDLGSALIASLGYMGSISRHQMYDYDATALGQITGAAQNPLINSINTFGSSGNSNSNMMLAGIRHQFSHTFSADAQFTWGHIMDQNSGPYYRDPYLYNPHYAYGRSYYDVNKLFKLFGVWQPVIFHGSNSWMEKIAGGWSLSGIMTLHSGFGWNPTYTAPHQFYCKTCNYGFPGLRPYYKGGAGTSTSNKAFETGSNFTNPGTMSTGANNNMFSDNYFSVPDFSAAITDGSTAFPATSSTTYMPAPGMDRNVFSGPGYRNVDANLTKAFGLPNSKILGENARLEIKADFFNIFNITNINPASLSTSVQAGNLGQASSALGSRFVDFQARFSF
ncbi:MAG TPA: carboxypeptidase regulatory-like domain-containing protein [Terracidiphilus sp.]|nr:carboxypeptidase regulatory-like domain-containing protein [Terracidiphilus sp.]